VGNKDMAYRVVADHIRTLSFAIADGARPGNEGREYVLRRVLRRGVRYGREVLGAKEGFFSTLVDSVVATMGPAFPELARHRDTIVEVIREEETSFGRTLVKGIERFKKAAAAAAGGKIAGSEAFLLWDTFGFPVDLTQLMAEEAGLNVDMAGFEAAMAEAKELSRAGAKKGGGAALKFEAEATAWLASSGVPRTDDAPKYGAAHVETRVAAILTASGFVQSTAEAGGGAVGVVLEATSFYAEAGGQVADTGALEGGNGAEFEVEDAQVAAGYVLHVGRPSPGAAALAVGDAVSARVDYARRDRIMPNHTFTHVLNFALRRVLGDHVDQKGSIVQPERLRFDFTNNGAPRAAPRSAPPRSPHCGAPLAGRLRSLRCSLARFLPPSSPPLGRPRCPPLPRAGPVDGDQLARVEAICQEFVAAARPVSAMEVPLAQAKGILGLRAVFGEVYPDPVRVVSVGRPVEELLADPQAASNADLSIEFCGGTHLSNTAAAGAFALLAEEGIAKGIRRIVAVTGADAAAAGAAADALAARAAALAARPPAEAAADITALKIAVDEGVIPAARKAALRGEVQALVKAVVEEQKKAAAANKERAVAAAVAAADAAAAAGAPYLVTRVPGVGLDAKALQQAWNAIQKRHPALAVMFFAEGEGKGMAYAGVPEDAAKKLPAGEWVGQALAAMGGRGGGKATSAQGMGPRPEAIDAAAALAAEMAAVKLGA
jgi:alanyl-tRNA synthetase